MRAWLFTTARNEHIDRWRRNEKHSQTTDPGDFQQMGNREPGVVDSLLDTFDRDEARAVIAALPRLLEPAQWKLVEDLYINNKSITEVAAELDVSKATIYARKMRVWKSIQLIARRQEERGVDLGLPSADIIKELLAAKENKENQAASNVPYGK